MCFFAVSIHRCIISRKPKQCRRASGGPEFAHNLLIIPDDNASQPIPSVNTLSYVPRERERDVLIAESRQNTRQSSLTHPSSLNNHQILNVASSAISLTEYEDMHNDNSGNELHFYASTSDMLEISIINKSYSPHHNAGNTNNSLDTLECLYNEIPTEHPSHSPKIKRPLPQRPAIPSDQNCNQISPLSGGSEVSFTNNRFTSCLDSVRNKSQEKCIPIKGSRCPMHGVSNSLSENEYASPTETGSSDLDILASFSPPTGLSSPNSETYCTIPDISAKRELQIQTDCRHDSLYFTLEPDKPSQCQNDRIDQFYQDETFNQRSPIPDEMIDNPLYNPFEQDR